MSDDGSSLSDDEGDMPTQPPGGGLLSWRMAPEVSLSDWKIEIVYDHTDESGVVSNKKDIYYVHRCFLAGGPRKSMYFAKLFKGGQYMEAQLRKSSIELHELIAKAFPVLLDYLYSADAKPKLTTENATALNYLSEYFSFKHLRWTVREFWMKDIKNAKTCGTYYEHAHILSQDEILQAAVQACREHIMRIDTSSRIVHVPDTSFWIKVLENGAPIERNVYRDGGDRWDGRYNIYRDGDVKWSRHVSKLVAAFVCAVPVDQENFQKLTNADVLPHIDGKVALSLIEAERLLFGSDDSSLTSLQERCIDAFTRDRNQIDNLLKEEAMPTLRNQNGRVLSELLVRSLRFTSRMYRGY
ncbi:hypothetical protein MPSEU_000071600 [Mayamaea pseudoterrestris]|nr:hypothetical protein MPSEU_000071600 [Mayamaea pseudoterrestris]